MCHAVCVLLQLQLMLPRLLLQRRPLVSCTSSCQPVHRARPAAAVVAQCCDALGVKGVAVEAQLYKLLLYEQGSHFSVHRDTEKAEGMWGELQLPLPLALGAVPWECRVRHAACAWRMCMPCLPAVACRVPVVASHGVYSWPLSCALVALLSSRTFPTPPPGTLVVHLPTAYEGGQLVVSHSGRSKTFDFAADSAYGMHWTAFYADCEHEVCVRCGQGDGPVAWLAA